MLAATHILHLRFVPLLVRDVVPQRTPSAVRVHQLIVTRLEIATVRVIKEGRVRTYDMGGKNTTIEVVKEVARHVQ